jgi:hypothetical protein
MPGTGAGTVSAISSLKLMVQQHGQQKLVECRLAGRREGEEIAVVGLKVGQGALPRLFQLCREGVQAEAQRPIERAPKPARALRFQLGQVEPDTLLHERRVEPKLCFATGGEGHLSDPASTLRSGRLAWCRQSHERNASSGTDAKTAPRRS